MDILHGLPQEWRDLLKDFLNDDIFKDLSHFVLEEYKTQTIYPSNEKIWNAFSFFSPKECKVVVVGQDPYHQPQQAQGLSFSVPSNIKIPPSLKNIYKEIEQEYGVQMYNNGDLTPWAEQGVLLLNRVLTVRDSQPNSHKKKGWEELTKEIIINLSALNNQLVFLLWGGPAQKLEAFIDVDKHLVLKANHPSPLSANRGGWFGNDHFIKTNEFLKKHNKDEIIWTNSPDFGANYQLNF